MAQGAPGAEKQAKDQNVTVTGCIENGTESPSTPAGTSGSATPAGSATSSSSANQFVLSSITGAPASITGIDRLSLSGKDSDLKKHVGHKVEITGKLENPSSSRPSSSTAGTPSSTAGTSGSTETLKVSSVKMIAESCSVK
jgi:hypothetical protein